MPNHLTAEECQQVLAVTPGQIEDAVLALAGFTFPEDVNLADPDKAFALRELRLTMEAALKEWKEKEGEVMARVFPALDAGYVVETKTQDTLNKEAAIEQQPDFWENYAYIPAEVAQRMEGRINQRDALRALYGVDRLPEETVRIQDVKDFLPVLEGERILNLDAKLVGKAVLLMREGTLYGHDLR